ncbi:flagellar assembly protein T N-terminal domain-containing protein [Marinicellulosiphila megalodicopiae]|uniref:flagellar assembly protein T N-terminal domain-containing protein n=1 Tax=Marinicellulosiphila megalodicopiae TaxID=2724896 RepID=UPI003BAFDE2B
MWRVITGLLALSVSFLAMTKEDDSYKWVEAQGMAAIELNQLQSAKNRAYRDALANASLQVNANIKGSQILENSSISVNSLTVNSSAKIEEVQILEQYESNGVYIVSIRAKVAKAQYCHTHVANNYSKSVAITGFELIDPKQTTLGHLGNVDQQLASAISNQLNQSGKVQALNANHLKINPNIQTAPSNFNAQLQLTQSQDAATMLGTQYVVSGVIRDLSMDNQDAPYARKWDKLLSKVKISKASRTRHFVFDLYVHDGYSGALLFQSRYSAQGIWNIKHNKKVGFATGVFNKTDYGQQVTALISKASDDIAQVIACQPYVVKIENTKQNLLYLDAGAQSGLRPGDAVSVYKTSQIFDRDQNAQWQLTDTKVMAVIKQVQPHFAIAELPMDARQLNIQMDDVIFAW